MKGQREKSTSHEIQQDVYLTLNQQGFKLCTYICNRFPSAHQSSTPLKKFCLLTGENISQHMQTCQHTRRCSRSQMFSEQLPIFWQSGFHSSHWPASPHFIGNLLFSLTDSYVKDAFSLHYKMPLKHLHSVKVHISVPHLSHSHTHTFYSKSQPGAMPCEAHILSSSPQRRQAQTHLERAVDVSKSIPQILPLWECLMCGSTRSNLLTPHLNTETLLLLLGPNVSLSSNVCVHECLWVYAHLLFCVYAYIIRRMFHMSTNRGWYIH